VPDLGVTPRGVAGQVELDALRSADWIAMEVDASDREVAVVEIHAYDRPSGPSLGTRCSVIGNGRVGIGDPGGCKVHAGAARLAGDRISHRLAASDACQPFVAPVGEPDCAGHDVSAMLGVG
jgi:hypothetical protein